MRERYSNAVAAEVRIKFLAYRARHLAKLKVGYSSVPAFSKFTVISQEDGRGIQRSSSKTFAEDEMRNNPYHANTMAKCTPSPGE